ncbi:MAG: hypothetical protein R3F33_10945 [Planctomycetota bacterium]
MSSGRHWRWTNRLGSVILAVGGVGAEQALAWQGADCGSAVPIAGYGTFVFDNSIGPAGSGAAPQCSGSWQAAGFFQWTATSAGDVRLLATVPGPMSSFSVAAGNGCAATCLGNALPLGGPGAYFREWNQAGVQAGDTFLLRIADLNGLGGSGELTIMEAPCTAAGNPDDGFEPNDSCAAPHVLSIGNYRNLVVRTSDPDHYAVWLPPMEAVTVTVSTGGPFVLLWDWDGNCQVGSSGISRSLVNLTRDPVLKHFEARPGFGSTCATYALTMNPLAIPCSVLPGQDDAFEPNDSCGAAVAMAPGTYTGLFASSQDPDFYSVLLQPGQQVTAIGSTNSSASGVIFQILDDSCGLLALGAGPLRHTNYSSQTEVVRVAPYTLGTSLGWCMEYDLTLQVADNPCAAIGEDPLVFHPDYEYLSSGHYPRLLVEGVRTFELCVPAGNTLDLDLELDSFVGLLEAEVVCYLPNDNCFFFPVLTSGSGQSFSLQWPNPGPDEAVAWLILEYIGPPADCNHVDLVVSGAGGCNGVLETASFCDPANVNSSGLPAVLFASQPFGPASLVQLEAVQGPAGQFGYLLVGTQTAVPGSPLGGGRLCLSGAGGNLIGRYNTTIAGHNSLGQFDAFGRFQNLAGTSNSAFGYVLPATLPWGATISAGSTYHYQLWFRESGGLSNLTGGVTVLW